MNDAQLHAAIKSLFIPGTISITVTLCGGDYVIERRRMKRGILGGIEVETFFVEGAE